MILADSILQTASIARCVSVAATATDHTIFTPSVQTEACRDFFFEAIPARWRSLCLGIEVLRPEHLVRADCSSIQEGELANLGLAIPARPVLLMKFHEPHRTFDRLFFRLQFKHRVPAKDFLGLGKRPVSHGKLSSRQPDARA